MASETPSDLPDLLEGGAALVGLVLTAALVLIALVMTGSIILSL